MTTLTAEQIKRQDEVDNAVMDLIIRMAPADKRDKIDWDMFLIGEVRETLEWALCVELKLMTEQEFYPYV